MRKIWIVSVVLLLCLVVCSACATDPVKFVDLSAVCAQLKRDLPIQDPLDIPTERLADLYGIQAQDVRTAACFVTMGGAFPDEVVMVEAADSAAAARISQQLQTHLAEITVQAQNYDAQSYAQFQKCQVRTVGNYVTLFCSAQAEQMQEIFDKAVN